MGGCFGALVVVDLGEDALIAAKEWFENKKLIKISSFVIVTYF